MTIETLRKKLHQELAKTDKAFDKHIAKYGCCTDDCTDRSRFQERIAALSYAIQLSGGRVDYKDKSTLNELK